MAFNDPNLSILVEQLSQRLQAVENQVAILSQQVGVPYSSGFAAAPQTGGVSFDPKTGTVSFDPAPAAPPMGVPATDPGMGGIPPEVVALARSNKKIQAIKLYRELTHCDLTTAKKVVDGL